MTIPDHVPDSLLDPLYSTPDDLPDLWPEDVLSDDEWHRGWLDRQIIVGRRTEADRGTTPRWLGGDA